MTDVLIVAALVVVLVGYFVLAHPLPNRDLESAAKATRARHALGRATSSASSVATSTRPRYGPGEADSGAPLSFLGWEGRRELSDVSAVPPVRLVGGRQTLTGSTRATSSATSTRGRLPADPRNTNARAHGTGVR